MANLHSIEEEFPGYNLDRDTTSLPCANPDDLEDIMPPKIEAPAQPGLIDRTKKAGAALIDYIKTEPENAVTLATSFIVLATLAGTFGYIEIQRHFNPLTGGTGVNSGYYVNQP
jgi:hypothetical protein